MDQQDQTPVYLNVKSSTSQIENENINESSESPVFLKPVTQSANIDKTLKEQMSSSEIIQLDVRAEASSSTELNLQNQFNASPEMIYKIARYHSEHVKTNRGLQDLLDLMNESKAAGVLPETSHLFKKLIGCTLNKSFSITTSCCNRVLHNIKSMKVIQCDGCSNTFALKQVVNSNNYSVRLVNLFLNLSYIIGLIVSFSFKQYGFGAANWTITRKI